MSGHKQASLCSGPSGALTAMALGLLMITLARIDGIAQTVETVRISAPPTLLFDIPDVSLATTSLAAPTTVSFDLAVLRPGRALRILVKADSDFQAPQGPSIPASNLSWTASGASNGVGLGGVLTRNQYRPVYESRIGAISGQVDLTWVLGSVSKTVRAGAHHVTLRWRLETITP